MIPEINDLRARYATLKTRSAIIPPTAQSCTMPRFSVDKPYKFVQDSLAQVEKIFGLKLDTPKVAIEIDAYLGQLELIITHFESVSDKAKHEAALKSNKQSKIKLK